MAENVGSIEYDARINTSQLKKDSRDVDRIAKDTGDSLDKNISKGTDSAGTAFKGLGLKIIGFTATLLAVVGAANLVGNSLSDLAGLQTARSGFEVLTGSAEEASKVMKDIATFANTTPFEFPDIAQAAKTLLGFGVAAADVDRNIRRIGDAAAAAGGDVKAVSVVFGQIFAAGKLNAQDFLQLINNGIALGPEIAKELGIPLSDLKKNIEDGNVTFDVFNRALTRATSEGGKYFQATAKLSTTLNGRISTLKDTFTSFIGAVVGVDFSTGIVAADGAFAKFSDGVKGLTDLLSDPEVQKSFSDIGKGISEGFRIASEAVAVFVDIFKPLISEIQQNQELWEAFKNSLIAIAAIIGLIVIAIGGALITALYVLGVAVDLIIEGFTNLWDLMQFIGRAIVAFFTAVGRQITMFMDNTRNTVRSFIHDVMSLFSNGGQAIADAFGRAFRATINSVLNFIGGKINGFIDTINGVIGTINKIPGVKIGTLGRLPIPQLAEGGIVAPRPGGVLANIAEGGQAEAVIPLDKLDDMVGGGQGITVNIDMNGIMTRSRSDMREVAADLIESLNEQLRARQVPEIGGGHLRRGIA